MHADNMDGAVTKRTIFSLRLGSTGSFPRPLKEEEEKKYLELAA